MELGKKLVEFLPFGRVASLAIDLAAQPVKDWLADLSIRRAFDNAVKHACHAFDARHPELSNEFFDGVFIEYNVSPLLAEFLNTRGQLPSAERIVEIWAARYHQTGKEARMAPYAAEFIAEVGRQIVAQKALRQYVSEGQLDNTVVLLDQIKSITLSLADGARQAELQEAFDLLMGAALTYQLAAELRLSRADRVVVATELRNADFQFRSGRMRLERMEYVATASLLADFELFVRLPFFAIVDAMAGGSGPGLDVAALKSGVNSFEESLREAP